MKKSQFLSWIGIIFLAAIFVTVFIRVLEMRITKGDIYSHYGSLRTDPLGGSGLFEAFQRMPEVKVERNFQSLMRIEGLDGETALLVLGVPRYAFDDIRIPDHSPVLEAVRDRGTRLVLTINPRFVPVRFDNTFSESEKEWRERRKELSDKRRAAGKGDGKPGEERREDRAAEDEDRAEEEKDAELGPRFEVRFGIGLADLDSFERPDEGWDARAGEGEYEDLLQDRLPVWKSQYRFEIDPGAEDAWRVVASVDGEPVAVERQLGEGSIVVTTDSYFAGNEALFLGGSSEFLLWLIGGKNRIVFDETLHGSVETTGVVKLLRQYRLHGLLIGVVVFVLLWGWRTSNSLAPGDEEVERGIVGEGGGVSGEQSSSGFTSLLRRSVPGDQLIGNCLEIWRSGLRSAISAEKKQDIDRIVGRHLSNPREWNVVDTYNEISRVLKKR